MRNFSLPLLLAVLAGLTAAPVLCGPDTAPLLRSHCTISYTDEIVPPPQSFFEDKDLTVAQSGEALHFRALQVNGGSFSSAQVRSAGGGAEFQDLRAALARARAGVQTSCSIADEVVAGRCEVTWYGRNGRRNVFVFELGPPTESSLPPCPPAVEELSGAIVRYEVFVLNHPS